MLERKESLGQKTNCFKRISFYGGLEPVKRVTTYEAWYFNGKLSVYSSPAIYSDDKDNRLLYHEGGSLYGGIQAQKIFDSFREGK